MEPNYRIITRRSSFGLELVILVWLTCGYVLPEAVNKSICSKNCGADHVNSVIFAETHVNRAHL